MKERDEFGQPRIGGEQLPHVFEGNVPVGGKKWEELLPKIEMLLIDSKAGLRAKGFSPTDRSRAATELGQLDLTPRNLRAESTRAEARGILIAVKNTPEDQRMGVDWEKMQDRAQEIFGPGIDLGAIAEVYDQRREAAANIAPAAPEPTAVPKDPEKEKDDYYRDQLLKDLGIAADKTAPTDERSKARARLTRNRVMFDRRIQLDDVRDIEAIILDPDARAALGAQLSDKLKNLSRLTGLDQPRLMRVHSGEIADDSDAAGNTRFDMELENILVAATVDGKIIPQLAKGELSRLRRKYAGNADARAVWEKAGQLLVALEAQSRGAASAYGLTQDQLRDSYGIETGNKTNDDPIILEIRRPVTGCEIPFEAMGSFAHLGMEKRRALNHQEAFSYNRTAELLAETYAAYLESYNGEVTNKSDMDPQLLGRIEAELKRKHDALKVQYEAAMRGEAGLHFLSLIPFPDKGGVSDDPLGLAAIREKILSIGFESLTPAELHMIPEIRTFEDLKALLSWHDAQSELIRTLQTIRSYATAKEIETMAGLGKSPDRLVMRISSITKLWTLETLDRRETENDEVMADDTDEAMRIYGLIAQVAIEPMGVNSGSTREKVIRALVREFLTGSTQITGGAKPKDSWYVLNRFGMNLSPERLATVEAFVDYLVANNVWNEVDTAGDIDLYMRGVKAGVGVAISTAVGNLKNGAIEMGVKTLGQKERRLAIDNAVAMTHVTGLADKWSGFLEWEEKEVDVPTSLPIHIEESKVWVGKTKVGIYPACTAGAEVANYKNFLLAQYLEKRLVSSQVLVDVLLGNGLPESLAHSFFTSTTLMEGTTQRDLWNLWWNEKQPLKSIAERMAGKVPENAIQFYFNSIAAAKKLADLMLGTDGTLIKEITENSKGQARIDSAITFGLGMPFGPEKTKMAERIKAIIYAGHIVYSMGFSGQITNRQMLEGLEDAKAGADKDSELSDTLQILISDFVRSSDRVRGLSDLQLKQIKQRLSGRRVPGAMNDDSMLLFVKIVDRYYRQARRKPLAQTGTLNEFSAYLSSRTPVLIDISGGDIPTKVLPFGKIWVEYTR